MALVTPQVLQCGRFSRKGSRKQVAAALGSSVQSLEIAEAPAPLMLEDWRKTFTRTYTFRRPSNHVLGRKFVGVKSALPWLAQSRTAPSNPPAGVT